MEEYTSELRKSFTAHKKPILVFLTVLFGLCAAGLIAAAFLDLRISQTLNNPNQPFSKFMSSFGEFPAYAFNTGFPVALFVWLVRKKKYYWSILPMIFAIAFGYYYFSQRYFVDSSLHLLLNLLFNTLWIASLCVLFSFISKDLLNKFLFILFIACIISALTNLVLIIFKTFWGRVRFTDLSDNLSEFTPWYQPNGITGHKSFFSGHVTSSCILTVLWLAPVIFKIKNRFVTILLFTIPIVWTLAMMYARIVVGAHYLSDTVFAVVSYTVLTILTMHILCRERLQKKPALTE